MSAVSNGCLEQDNWLETAEKKLECSISLLTQTEAMNAFLGAAIKTAQCLCPSIAGETVIFGCTIGESASKVTFADILARIECGNNLLQEFEVWGALARLEFARFNCCEESPIYA